MSTPFTLRWASPHISTSSTWAPRKKEVPIRIEVPVNDAEGNVELFVVKQHDDVYKKAYDKLSKNPMTITKFEDTAVRRDQHRQGQMLYTSINYDEGSGA